MIGFRDTTLLAFTKLRTRKIRTAATILLASLLFGALVAASLVVTGAFSSIENFRRDGLTSRYIVSVYPVTNYDEITKLRRDPKLVAEAKKRYEKLVQEKTAEAKRLNVPYSSIGDAPPLSLSPDGSEEYLAAIDKNNIIYSLMSEYYTSPVINDGALATTAKRYGATSLFYSQTSDLAHRGTIDVFPSGKEDFYDQSDETERNAKYTPPVLDAYGMTIAPPEITTPFMFQNNAGWKPDSASIPILLPQNTVERILGKDTSIDKTNIASGHADLKQLRVDAEKLSFQACYRNNASVALIQQTIQQQKEIKANEGKKDYQKPPVIYKLPDSTKCENPSVISDTRTAGEKKQDDNQKIFDIKYNNLVEPVSYFVPFKVVGISPPQSDNGNPYEKKPQANTIDDVVRDLLKTDGIGQVVPRTLYDQIPEVIKKKYNDLFVYKPTYIVGNEDNRQRYIEFANAKDAQKFIDEQGCKTEVDGKCHPFGRDYMLNLAFTNSVALDDIRAKVSGWFGYVMLGTVLLASVIMWITIGRTIADGRRETAVFRAIGFKRGDIAMVYILYTFLLSVLVIVFAAAIGLISAVIVNQQLSPSLTTQAQYAFGGLNLVKKIDLIEIDLRQLLVIFVACLITGLLSMIIPLLSNVRRNPIRDMREE